MSKDDKSLSHSTWNCKYHIVFAPKYRRMVIYGKLKAEIGRILRELCDRKGMEIIEANACPDHIHMLVSIPPKMAVSEFVGETDLATANLELAAEWDYERNEGITPDMVTAYSNKSVFWKCAKGHSWVATINNRTKGYNCPYCSGRMAIVGETDLATLNTKLALEWDYERNKGVTPEMVTAHSDKKYFWRCKKGHSWVASIANRSKGTGCPYCR